MLIADIVEVTVGAATPVFQKHARGPDAPVERLVRVRVRVR